MWDFEEIRTLAFFPYQDACHATTSCTVMPNSFRHLPPLYRHFKELKPYKPELFQNPYISLKVMVTCTQPLSVKLGNKRQGANKTVKTTSNPLSVITFAEILSR
jgi:hypothetical protein